MLKWTVGSKPESEVQVEGQYKQHEVKRASVRFNLRFQPPFTEERPNVKTAEKRTVLPSAASVFNISENSYTSNYSHVTSSRLLCPMGDRHWKKMKHRNLCHPFRYLMSGEVSDSDTGSNYMKLEKIPVALEKYGSERRVLEDISNVRHIVNTDPDPDEYDSKKCNKSFVLDNPTYDIFQSLPRNSKIVLAHDQHVAAALPDAPEQVLAKPGVINNQPPGNVVSCCDGKKLRVVPNKDLRVFTNKPQNDIHRPVPLKLKEKGKGVLTNSVGTSQNPMPPFGFYFNTHPMKKTCQTATGQHVHVNKLTPLQTSYSMVHLRQDSSQSHKKMKPSKNRQEKSEHSNDSHKNVTSDVTLRKPHHGERRSKKPRPISVSDSQLLGSKITPVLGKVPCRTARDRCSIAECTGQGASFPASIQFTDDYNKRLNATMGVPNDGFQRVNPANTCVFIKDPSPESSKTSSHEDKVNQCDSANTSPNISGEELQVLTKNLVRSIHHEKSRSLSGSDVVDSGVSEGILSPELSTVCSPRSDSLLDDPMTVEELFLDEDSRKGHSNTCNNHDYENIIVPQPWYETRSRYSIPPPSIRYENTIRRSNSMLNCNKDLTRTVGNLSETVASINISKDNQGNLEESNSDKEKSQKLNIEPAIRCSLAIEEEPDRFEESFQSQVYESLYCARNGWNSSCSSKDSFATAIHIGSKNHTYEKVPQFNTPRAHDSHVYESPGSGVYSYCEGCPCPRCANKDIFYVVDEDVEEDEKNWSLEAICSNSYSDSVLAEKLKNKVVISGPCSSQKFKSKSSASTKLCKRKLDVSDCSLWSSPNRYTIAECSFASPLSSSPRDVQGVVNCAITVTPKVAKLVDYSLTDSDLELSNLENAENDGSSLSSGAESWDSHAGLLYAKEPSFKSTPDQNRPKSPSKRSPRGEMKKLEMINEKEKGVRGLLSRSNETLNTKSFLVKTPNSGRIWRHPKKTCHSTPRKLNFSTSSAKILKSKSAEISSTPKRRTLIRTCPSYIGNKSFRSRNPRRQKYKRNDVLAGKGK